MAPAKPLSSGEDGAIHKLAVKLEENDGDYGEKKGDDELRLVCESNFEDSGFHGDSSPARDRMECSVMDQDVDVVGLGGGEEAELEESEDPDLTEQSSSFGNSFLGSEEEADEAKMNDGEVDSQLSTDPGDPVEQLTIPDGLGKLVKRKKVTAHWRKFISPVMWRCQWLELRMNELRSQSLLYEKELAAYKREKKVQAMLIELDDSVARVVPLSSQYHTKRAMKRSKRRRIEDTVDVSSYMSNHSIFSYHENKKSETDCQSVDNDSEDQGDEVTKVKEDYEPLLLGLKDGDNPLENILLNLDGLQSRILDLKAQLSQVMCSRDGSSSAMTNFVQGDPPTSYARSLSCSPENNGEAMTHHHAPEYELEMPDSTVSSYGDAVDRDIIGCTAGLLSTDVPLRPCHGRDLYKETADDILIHNQAAEDELKHFEKLTHNGGKFHEEAKEESQSCSEDAKPVLRAPVLTRSPASGNGRLPILKPCYTGKKRGRKPKRKRRGASVSSLNQKRRFS